MEIPAHSHLQAAALGKTQTAMRDRDPHRFPSAWAQTLTQDTVFSKSEAILPGAGQKRREKRRRGEDPAPYTSLHTLWLQDTVLEKKRLGEAELGALPC